MDSSLATRPLSHSIKSLSTDFTNVLLRNSKELLTHLQNKNIAITSITSFTKSAVLRHQIDAAMGNEWEDRPVRDDQSPRTAGLTRPILYSFRLRLPTTHTGGCALKRDHSYTSQCTLGATAISK